jgi:MFS family permease
MSCTTTLELSEFQTQAEIPTYNPLHISNQRNIKANSHELDNLPSGAPASHQNPSKLRITLTILQPCLVNFFSSFTSGIITVALPAIASSLSIPDSLYLWPSSVYGLTSGAALLMAGSIADLVGARNVELVGILLLSTFVLAQSFSSTGIQFIIFRALQGVALAMHIPASVSLVSAGVPEGRARNFGFGCLGMSQPLGFSVGLVASGIMVERAGWRSAFYLSAAGLFLATIPAFWVLPKVEANRQMERSVWTSICREIDWVGGGLASGGLAMLAYVLA